jgi:cysteine desulfurase
MEIYLDYNAGAPLRAEARKALAEFLTAEAGNPASVHRSGQRARRALERARAQVAALIDAAPRQLVFTSGGTEANNLAIFGAVKAQNARRKIITSLIEHSSILGPLKSLEAAGFLVRWLAPDGKGRISAKQVLDELDHTTALVTLGLANSETGAIQDLGPLAAPVRQAGALLHIDAAQAAGRMTLSVGRLNCDFMSLSGHKLGALAGIGALYVRDERLLNPLMFGGPQERGVRPGTPNVLGAVSMGAAAETVRSRLSEEINLMSVLTERLRSRLFQSIPGLALNGPLFGRIPNTLNLAFPGARGESLLIALDLEGVRVSMGSACAAGAVEPSHVLIAMGRSAREARSSLRLSLGPQLTLEAIDRAAIIIARVWERVAAAQSSEEEVCG